MNVEATSNLVGLIIAAIVSGWVRYDARKRGLKPASAIGWSVGVLLALIIFLPLYWVVVMRSRPLIEKQAVNASVAPIAGVPCPYCGFENTNSPDFCAKCGRMLRSSTEIHRPNS